MHVYNEFLSFSFFITSHPSPTEALILPNKLLLLACLVCEYICGDAGGRERDREGGRDERNWVSLVKFAWAWVKGYFLEQETLNSGHTSEENDFPSQQPPTPIVTRGEVQPLPSLWCHVDWLDHLQILFWKPQCCEFMCAVPVMSRRGLQSSTDSRSYSLPHPSIMVPECWWEGLIQVSHGWLSTPLPLSSALWPAVTTAHRNCSSVVWGLPGCHMLGLVR